MNGELTESIGSGQAAEIQAREIEVLGACDNTYPLQKKGHTMEFLREIAHLRPRTNTSAQCSAFVTIWQLLSISFFMNVAFSTSILLLLQHQTVKEPVRCSRLLPRISMT